jgi:hypothetical protein
LTFADPASHPSLADEKARYDTHQNRPDDYGYRMYLNRLAEPLLKRLQPGMRGLDYGCGPGPTLSLMLEEAGMVMSVYDPFYADEETVLTQQYDFVTCTEVVEHFRDPAGEWKRLTGLVVPGGWLGVMTQLMPGDDPETFLRWRYRNDRTHLCFYTARTFEWIAKELSLDVDSLGGDVVTMRRKLETSGFRL